MLKSLLKNKSLENRNPQSIKYTGYALGDAVDCDVYNMLAQRYNERIKDIRKLLRKIDNLENKNSIN